MVHTYSNNLVIFIKICNLEWTVPLDNFLNNLVDNLCDKFEVNFSVIFKNYFSNIFFFEQFLWKFCDNLSGCSMCKETWNWFNLYIRGFTKFGIKVAWRLQFLEYLVEDLKFKISEGSDQNWCFPDSAQLAVSAKL